MSRKISGLFLSLFLAACGSSVQRQDDGAPSHPSPTDEVIAPTGKSYATVAGDIAGAKFAPVQAVFAEGKFNGEASGLMVAMGDAERLCESIQNQRVLPGASMLGFGMFDSSDLHAPTSNETYSPTSAEGRLLFSQFYRFNDDCDFSGEGGAVLFPQMGELHLAKVVHGEFASGTFSIVPEEGAEPIEGTFHATYCDAHKVLEGGGFTPSGCLD